MSDTKVSGLPEATTLVGTDELPINNAGTSKKTKVSTLRKSAGTVPTIVSVGAEFTSTGTPTATLPGTHALNDILVLVIQTSNQAFTTPAGYARMGSAPGVGAAAAAGATKLFVFWKRDGGSEVAPTLSDSGDHTYGVMFAVRGCPAVGDPFRMLGSAWKFTASTTGTGDAGSTRTANSLVVTMFAHALDQAGAAASAPTNASLTSVTEQFDDSTTDGTGGGIAIVSGIKADPGDVSGTTVTWSGSTVDVSLTVSFVPEDAFPMARGPESDVFVGSPANLDDTWTKPVGARKVTVMMTGAGASGSAGRNAATAAGGGGGGGGAYAEFEFEAEDLPATVTLHAGAGGAATANTDGAASTAGADSWWSSSSGPFVAAGGKAATASATGAGGAGGAGGGFASATPAAGAFSDTYGSQPPPGGTGATTAAAGSRANDFGGGGGAGGGTTQAATAGGLSRRGGGGGGGGRSNTTPGTGGAGGSGAGGGANTAGGASTVLPYGGGGGGGGGSATGQGGIGGLPGGGGGGGGSASGSQRGEAGGHGMVMVTVVF